MQEQPELIGCGHLARGAVGRQMRLPRLDVIFGLAAPAVDVLIKGHGRCVFSDCGDDEARVWPFRADFDARDDPLDAAPA